MSGKFIQNDELFLIFSDHDWFVCLRGVQKCQSFSLRIELSQGHQLNAFLIKIPSLCLLSSLIFTEVLRKINTITKR